MAFLKVKNRAYSTLASGVSDVATEWTVATGEGSRFPTTGDFHVTCEDEIVKCTSRTGDVLTVTRAQEGTAAAAHSSGKDVELRITVGVIENLQNMIMLERNASVMENTAGESSRDWTDYDLDTAPDFALTFPNNAKAIIFTCSARDSGSSGADCGIGFRKNGETGAGQEIWSKPCGVVNDVWAPHTFIVVEFDANHIIETKIIASGTGTFDWILRQVGWVIEAQ